MDAYIKHCISELPNLQDDEDLQAQVRDAMRRKANGTFLWVSLVVEELKNAKSWEVEQIVDQMPSGLEKVYSRMLPSSPERICPKGNDEQPEPSLNDFDSYEPWDPYDDPSQQQTQTNDLKLCLFPNWDSERIYDDS